MADGFGIPYWAYINPQAITAALPDPGPIVEPILEPFIPRIVPDPTPESDPQVQYPGQGAVALWNDVWHYGKSILSYFGRSGGGLQYITTDNLNQAVDDVMKATITSLSGYINVAHDLAVDGQRWAANAIDRVNADVGWVYQFFDARVGALENIGKYVTEFAFPLVEDQLATLRHDMNLADQFVSGVDRAWSIDHIFTPLEDELGQLRHDALTWADDAYQRAIDHADLKVLALGAATLTALQPLQQAVKALQTEAEQCTTPLCETMGPKTDLGKLLKGLQLALAAGALAEIANANEQDVADAITRIGSHLATVIGTFETSFVTGGGTVADLVAAELGNLI